MGDGSVNMAQVECDNRVADLDVRSFLVSWLKLRDLVDDPLPPRVRDCEALREGIARRGAVPSIRVDPGAAGDGGEDRLAVSHLADPADAGQETAANSKKKSAKKNKGKKKKKNSDD